METTEQPIVPTPQSTLRLRIEQLIKDERQKELNCRDMGWENQERFHNIRRQAFNEVLQLISSVRIS